MLNDSHLTVPQQGELRWIGVAAAPQSSIEVIESVEIEQGHGLVGDHHAKSKPDTKRQVSLIQFEHLPVIAQLCGKESVDPTLLRRNLVISGINLLSLKHQEFRIGSVRFQASGLCAPCSLMERNLGPGGYQAMRGHGGIVAKALTSGRISIGDAVVWERARDD